MMQQDKRQIGSTDQYLDYFRNEKRHPSIPSHAVTLSMARESSLLTSATTVKALVYFDTIHSLRKMRL